MSDLTLTPAEIHKLTGLEQPAAQERYLVEVRGIPAYRNRANEVVVLRADLNREAQQGRAAPGPRLDFLDETG